MRLIDWRYYVYLTTLIASRHWKSVPALCLYYSFHKGTQKCCVSALYFNHSVFLLTFSDDFNCSEPLSPCTSKECCTSWSLVIYSICFPSLLNGRDEQLDIDLSNCRVHSHALCLQTHWLRRSASSPTRLSPFLSHCFSIYLNSYLHGVLSAVLVYSFVLSFMKRK